MISCQLLVCAKGVVRDVETGGISVFNILEDIQAGGFPLFMPEMAILAFFEREQADPAQHTIRFRLAIGQTEVFGSSLEIDFRDKLRNRSIVQVFGLPIPHPGFMKLSAEDGDKVLLTYTMIIEKLGRPTIAVQTGPAEGQEIPSPSAERKAT